MLQAGRIRITLAAGVAALALSGGAEDVRAQAPNSQPNPYLTVENFFKLPEGRKVGSTAAIDIDRDGSSIWIFERCGAGTCEGSTLAPLVKFDSSGKAVKSLGAGMFLYPHGIHVDREGNIWVSDGRGKDGKGQQVFKLNSDGKVLLTLGTAGVAGAGPDTFNQPSDIAVGTNGDIFVADGHGGDSNARIVKFTKDGKFIKTWGKKGPGPGEFDTPHNLAFDSRGRLFVADRGTAGFRSSTRMENSSTSGSSSAGRAESSSTRTTRSTRPTRSRTTSGTWAGRRASESEAPKTARSRSSFPIPTRSDRRKALRRMPRATCTDR